MGGGGRAGGGGAVDRGRRVAGDVSVMAGREVAQGAAERDGEATGVDPGIDRGPEDVAVGRPHPRQRIGGERAPARVEGHVPDLAREVPTVGDRHGGSDSPRPGPSSPPGAPERSAVTARDPHDGASRDHGAGGGGDQVQVVRHQGGPEGVGEGAAKGSPQRGGGGPAQRRAPEVEVGREMEVHAPPLEHAPCRLRDRVTAPRSRTREVSGSVREPDGPGQPRTIPDAESAPGGPRTPKGSPRAPWRG